MAERRMFAKSVVQCDAFLDLPLTSQALYFHLGMEADDDGFLNNANKVMRSVGAATDDMKLLIAKGFLIDVGDGILVVRHWNQCNYLRNDRYKPTLYDDKKALLSQENGRVYTLISERYTIGIPDDNHLDTQYRLGKDSIDKPPIVPQGTTLFSSFWEAYPRKEGKNAARKAFARQKPTQELLDEMLTAIEAQKRSAQWQRDGGQYIPHPATWLNQGRWMDEPPITTPASGDFGLHDVREEL